MEGTLNNKTISIYSKTVAGNQDGEGDQHSITSTYENTTQLRMHSPISYEVPVSMDQSESSFPHVTYYDAINVCSKRAAEGQTYDLLNRGIANGMKIGSTIKVHLIT